MNLPHRPPPTILYMKIISLWSWDRCHPILPEENSHRLKSRARRRAFKVRMPKPKFNQTIKHTY